jgi:hypothetical protein
MPYLKNFSVFLKENLFLINIVNSFSKKALILNKKIDKKS